MKSVLLALSVATISLSLAACGPTTDPSKNNTANNENNTSTNNTSMNNTSTNNTSMNNTSTNNTSMNNTSTNNTSTNNMTAGPCEVATSFFGQVDPDNDFDDHSGGAPTMDALTTDAGLGAAMTEFDTIADGESKTVDLAVTGATVTATNFGEGGNVNFWVEDANAAFQFFLGFDGCGEGTCTNAPTAETIKVGDNVNFTITELNNYFGAAQITAVSDFTIESSGNAVPYTDLTGQVIDVDAYLGRIVRIGGRLSEQSTDCGGSDCFDMMHGDQVAQYRINADNSNTFGGDCVTFFGPLSSFQDAPSLNVANFAWRLPVFDN